MKPGNFKMQLYLMIDKVLDTIIKHGNIKN